MAEPEPEITYRPRIYLAGPYSRPDPCVNTHRAIEIANILWDAGFAPYLPHLTHFWHTVTPKPYETWLEYDRQFLPCCDAVFRIDGESSGADREVAWAQELGMPIFHDLKSLKDHFSRSRPWPNSNPR